MEKWEETVKRLEKANDDLLAIFYQHGVKDITEFGYLTKAANLIRQQARELQLEKKQRDFSASIIAQLKREIAALKEKIEQMGYEMKENDGAFVMTNEEKMRAAIEKWMSNYSSSTGFVKGKQAQLDFTAGYLAARNATIDECAFHIRYLKDEAMRPDINIGFEEAANAIEALKGEA